MSKTLQNISNPNGISMIASIDGVDEIINGLKLLASENNYKDFDNLTNIVSSELAQQIKSAAPVDEGNLKNSIGIFQSKKNPRFLWVGPRYATKKSLFEGGNHAHFVEYGTVSRYTGTKSKYVSAAFAKAGVKSGYRGIMPSRPFIRPVYDANKGQILEKLKKGYEKIFVQAATKTGIFSVK